MTQSQRPDAAFTQRCRSESSCPIWKQVHLSTDFRFRKPSAFNRMFLVRTPASYTCNIAANSRMLRPRRARTHWSSISQFQKLPMVIGSDQQQTANLALLISRADAAAFSGLEYGALRQELRAWFAAPPSINGL